MLPRLLKFVRTRAAKPLDVPCESTDPTFGYATTHGTAIELVMLGANGPL